MCDTTSHGSDHLWLIWKESIQNCRCYRADTAAGTDGRTDRRTDGRTDRRTDGVKQIYPPTTSLFGGYNYTFEIKITSPRDQKVNRHTFHITHPLFILVLQCPSLHLILIFVSTNINAVHSNVGHSGLISCTGWMYYSQTRCGQELKMKKFSFLSEKLFIYKWIGT